MLLSGTSSPRGWLGPCWAGLLGSVRLHLASPSQLETAAAKHSDAFNRICLDAAGACEVSSASRLNRTDFTDSGLVLSEIKWKGVIELVQIFECNFS